MVKKTLIALVFAALVILSAVPAFAAKIFLGEILSSDGTIISEAMNIIPMKLSAMGHEVVTVRSEAKYEMQVVLTGQVVKRFNVVILFVPVWPIVPVLTQGAFATAVVKLIDVRDDQQVYSNVGTGDETVWVLADLTSSESVLLKAVGEAITVALAGANAYLLK
jgi:hypothetical protein